MIYRFDDCALDVERRELRCGGELRHVEPQVFDLLHFLLRERDRVVSREAIFKAVWHGRFVSDEALSTRINAARRAIGDDGTRQRLIRTERRSGFRFVGAVSAGVREQSAPVAIPTYRLAAELPDAPVVALLPFACIGEGDRARLTAQALREEIAAGLHDIDWLRTATSGCSDDYDGPAVGLKTRDGKSRSAYLLHGCVRVGRDETHTVVRLTDAASGIQLWAERFRSRSDGYFEEVAANVTGALSNQIFAAESRRNRQRNQEGIGAWNTIVRAVALMNTRKKPDVRLAQALLRQAIELDPKSAPCFSLLSIVATLSVHLGWKAQEAARPIALGAAEKAVDLNSEDGWSHVALGYSRLLLDNRPEEAIDILATALKLNPNLAIAHYFTALASAYTGDTVASFRHAELAEHLAPRDLLMLGNSGAQDNVRATASFVADRYQDGIAFARKTIALSPRQTSAYRQLVLNHAFAGERQQAAAALATIRNLAPDISRWLQQQETRWSNRQDHEKYVDAFRLAGMK